VATWYKQSHSIHPAHNLWMRAMSLAQLQSGVLLTKPIVFVKQKPAG